ncbi:MAG TPA: antitoxin family protein [Thermodesulfobacteriota bacterium]|nr:antitoxin family protein [Thermodesulfobacteriota bacterium]
MSKRLEAVYENGVLRLLEPLDLREHERVTLIVSKLPAIPSEEEWLVVECLQLYAAEVDESISLEAVRKALSKIPGSLTVVRLCSPQADFVAEREEH